MLHGLQLDMINYQLHHIGLLTSDPTAAALFYKEVLQFEEVARFVEAGQFELTFLSAASPLLLELVGPPFSSGELTFIEKRGSAMHHIAFETENVDLAFEDLTQKGLEVAWEPDEFEFVRHCAVLDNNGVVIEILQELEPLPPVVIRPNPPICLHHVCILSHSWQETLAFYETHLGMRSPFQYIYDHGGAFAYLADSAFDLAGHNILLEVIGPPYEERREFAFAEAFGTGLDHLGLVVPNVDAAYQTYRARQVGEEIPPYAGYGTEMFWGKDRDRNDLEFMLPLPSEKLQEALLTGNPYRPAG